MSDFTFLVHDVACRSDARCPPGLPVLIHGNRSIMKDPATTYNHLYTFFAMMSRAMTSPTVAAMLREAVREMSNFVWESGKFDWIWMSTLGETLQLCDVFSPYCHPYASFNDCDRGKVRISLDGVKFGLAWMLLLSKVPLSYSQSSSWASQLRQFPLSIMDQSASFPFVTKLTKCYWITDGIMLMVLMASCQWNDSMEHI